LVLRCGLGLCQPDEALYRQCRRDQGAEEALWGQIVMSVLEAISSVRAALLSARPQTWNWNRKGLHVKVMGVELAQAEEKRN
jgi:hypothetical protein